MNRTLTVVAMAVSGAVAAGSFAASFVVERAPVDDMEDYIRSQAVDPFGHSQWSDGVDVMVFMVPEASDQADASMRQRLDATSNIESYYYLDQDGAYEEFKLLFADKPDLVESVVPDVLPPSYRMHLIDDEIATMDRLVGILEGMDGVREAVRKSPGFEEMRLYVASEPSSVDRNIDWVLRAIGLVSLVPIALLAATLRRPRDEEEQTAPVDVTWRDEIELVLPE